MNFSDEREYKEVSKAVFYMPKVVRENFNQEQKIYNSALFKLRIKFDSFKGVFKMYFRISVVMIVLSLIVLGLSINVESNLIYGILTLVSGGLLFAFSFSYESIFNVIKSLTAILTLIFVFEILVFGIPDALFYESNVYALKRRTALIETINQISPFLYLTFKVVLIGVLYYSIYLIKEYSLAKANFESLEPKIKFEDWKE
jgi:hypothetical protein